MILDNFHPSSYYKKQKIETSSLGDLIILLYEEAIRLIDMTIKDFEALKKKKELKDPNQSELLTSIHKRITKVQDIINELILGLNFEKEGRAIAKPLQSLYIYMNNQLIQANIKKEDKNLFEVRKYLKDILDSWKDAIKKEKLEADKQNRPQSLDIKT